MRLISTLLTLLLKIIFITVFSTGVFIVSVLMTYGNQDYYSSGFLSNFVDMQAMHIEDFIDNTYDLKSFGFVENEIAEVITNSLPKELLEQGVQSAFSSIRTYDGDTIRFDVIAAKTAYENIIKNTSSLIATKSNGKVSKENVERELRANMRFSLPETIEINDISQSTDSTLRTLKFLITKRMLVIFVLASLALAPIIGIISLNSHPIYRGIRIASYSLITGGVFTILLKFIMTHLFTFISELSVKELIISGAEVTTEQIANTALLLVSDILNLTFMIGCVTLIIGILFFVVSSILKKRDGSIISY